MRRRSDKVNFLYGPFSLMDAHAQFSVPIFHEMGRLVKQFSAGCVGSVRSHHALFLTLRRPRAVSMTK